MTDDADSTDDRGVGGSGYSLEDLSAYLDRGRTPRIAAIDTNAECQSVLASMERMGALSRDLVARESARPLDEGWYDGLMREIMREFRAGSDIPLRTAEPESGLYVTEGALYELVRAAGDEVPGILVGRTKLRRDAETGEFDVTITVSVRFGERVEEVADAARAAVAAAIESQGDLRVRSVDVTVDNVHLDDGEGDA